MEGGNLFEIIGTETRKAVEPEIEVVAWH